MSGHVTGTAAALVLAALVVTVWAWRRTRPVQPAFVIDNDADQPGAGRCPICLTVPDKEHTP